MNTRLLKLLVLVFAVNLASMAAYGERIKDIATVAGVRSNQLVGYGLVVGLDGTGDQTSQAPFTIQSLKSMLAQFGIVVPAGVTSQLKNVAAVAVNAELAPFAKPGQLMDVTVSSLANAKSLRGGTLLMTPLKGANGDIYAMAQGSLVVGGFGAEGSDGSKITVNIPSAGRIPGGATVEKMSPSSMGGSDVLVFNLHEPDFTTAKRMADAINDTIGMGSARPLDATSVMVQAPRDMAQRVSYVSVLENLTLEPGEAPARIIINSRTGTVVIGEHVRVTAAAVSHGNLTRSPHLARSILSVAGKLESLLESKLQRAIREIGLPIAHKLSIFAQKWGNVAAEKWASDEGFARYWAAIRLNERFHG